MAEDSSRKTPGKGRRPAHLAPPAYLSPSPPVPEPEAPDTDAKEKARSGPTRYGDWVRNGIAVDF